MSETALRAAPHVGHQPYIGLMPYAEKDAPLFFGRKAEREIITANLIASRLTLLYGASGVGKSSVLHAGVAFHLRQLAQEHLAEHGTPEFVLVVFSAWRDDPLVGLADGIRDAVAQALNVKPPEPVPPLRSFAQTLQAWSERVDGDLLIILDQFEEYFLYHAQEDGEGTFAIEFPRAVNRLDLRANFLVSIREDSLAKLDRFKGRIPNLFDNYLRIEHLDREAARMAIENPIEPYNRLQVMDEQRVSIEPALVEAVLEQIRTGRVTLGESGEGIVKGEKAETRIETPFLQLVMTRLWDEEMRAGSHILRLETMDRLGGAERIVRTHLDAVMSTLLPTEQDIAASVFHYLVTPSGTKIAHTVSDLAEYAQLPQMQLSLVLEKLCRGDVRILRPVAPPPDQPGKPRYETFHDVLALAILDWRARRVQEQERAEAAKREAARQHELEQAQALAREQERRAEEQARIAARLRRQARALVVVSLLVVGVCLLAWTNWHLAATRAEEAEKARAEAGAAQKEAETERDRAEQQRQLSFSREVAAAAINNLDIDPQRSVLLALHAASVTYWINKTVVPETEDALHRGLQALRVQYTLSGHTDAVYGVAFSPDGTRLATAGMDNTAKMWDVASGQEVRTLSGHTDAVYGVAFSPDGTRLATASWDKTAKMWDVASGQEVRTLSGHTDAVYGVAFSPDGTRLATAGMDKTAKVWDVASGQEVRAFSGHTNTVYGVAFSPDGTRLATASWDKTAKVWDVASGQEVRTFSGHTNMVIGVAFSPDGTRLATAGDDDTAKVWDVASGQEVRTFSGHTNTVFGVAFSPDGTRLATAGGDNTAKMWDISSGREVHTLSGHTNTVFGVAFSPDGTRLATASGDSTAKVWDISSGREVHTLSGHTNAVYGVAFSPDGTRLATASWDKTAKVWDISSGREVHTLSGHTNAVYGVAFSPDGTRLATAGMDKTAKVWDVASGQEVRTFSGHTNTVFGVAFSPDGMRLATASGDNTAKVWDISSGREVHTLSGHTNAVYGVAFSPDGMRLATASGDNTAKVWDISSGREVHTLSGHTDEVYGVAFSPDGTRLATAGMDNTAKMWDVASGQEVRTLSGHTDTVFRMAFSPDGTRLATASRDKTAKVWNVASGRDMHTLTGHTSAVYGVAFSPDGTRLATASHDRTARVYAVKIEDLMSLVRRRITRSLTSQECQKYLHEKERCPVPATALKHVVEGRNLARASNVDNAVLSFRKALDLDPTIGFDPEMEARQSAAEVLVEKGQRLAKKEDVDSAIVSFRKALELDPTIGFDPEAETKRLVAEVLVEKGQRLLKVGDVDGAIATLQKALERNPRLFFDRQVKGGKLPTEVLIEAGTQLVTQGQVKEAISAYAGAEKIDPALKISAESWNSLCWFASLWGYAADVVMNACELAVAPDLENWLFRDSRGVARAMTGNVEGAIEDFEAFIGGTDNVEMKSQRQRWVNALYAGEKNPITPEDIKIMLKQ